ncbi:EF hand [Gracilaria domingensis]|nr:EF hand [Gracilaria domingensis]
MRLVVLTDFSSNPFLAMRDRIADPLSAVMLAVAAVLGGIASWVLTRNDNGLDLPAGTSNVNGSTKMSETEGGAREVYQIQDDDNINITTLPSPTRATAGENAVWLNMSAHMSAQRFALFFVQLPESRFLPGFVFAIYLSLSTLWRLFRKSTNGIVKDVLQPVLNDMQFPDFVQSVKITNLTLGESPCLLRRIQRLPSRALNEIQYRYSLRLVGDKEGRINMDVVIRLPALNRLLTVPICISALDIDAKVWLGLTVVPYKPWLRFAQWALTGMPTVRMNISVANIIPITAIPVLSNVLRRILTVDLPREFMFPKTQLVDLMDEEEVDVGLERSVLEARGINSSFEDMSNEELCASFPVLTSLFSNIDINGDGQLSPEEVSKGLVEWGYASQADRRSITNLLDVDNDGIVSLKEFVSVWGDLKNVFIPKRFRGIVSGVLIRAEGLRLPVFGFTDPYVVISIESQTVTSKRNRATSRTGDDIGSAVWNEGWELYVEQPESAVLRVEVREGSRFTFFKGALPPPSQKPVHSGALALQDPNRIVNGRGTLIGYGSLSVSTLSSFAEALWVDLTTGGGRIRLDVQFNEFIDPSLA